VKITAQEEYGLRCMVQVARSRGDEPLTISEIARREGLSLPYVGKLMNLLRQARLVESVRGRSGGYVLPRDPGKISLMEIVEALGGELFERDYCDRHPAGQDSCVHVDECSIRGIWGAVDRIIRDVLSRTTLADLLESEEKVVQIAKSMPVSPWPYGQSPPPGDDAVVSGKTEDIGGRDE
jgi:Rrf2 family protein